MHIQAVIPLSLVVCLEFKAKRGIYTYVSYSVSDA